MAAIANAAARGARWDAIVAALLLSACLAATVSAEYSWMKPGCHLVGKYARHDEKRLRPDVAGAASRHVSRTTLGWRLKCSVDAPRLVVRAPVIHNSHPVTSAMSRLALPMTAAAMAAAAGCKTLSRPGDRADQAVRMLTNACLSLQTTRPRSESLCAKPERP